MGHNEKLAAELRGCGLNRMAAEAAKGLYENDAALLVVDLRYALTLKSLTAVEVGKIGRLHKRALDGEFATEAPEKQDPPGNGNNDWFW